MTQRIYKSLLDAKQRGQKRFAVLIDPDKMRLGNMDKVISLAIRAKVDYFFVGGSLVRAATPSAPRSAWHWWTWGRPDSVRV